MKIQIYSSSWNHLGRNHL